MDVFAKAKNLKMMRLQDNRWANFDEEFLPLLRKGTTVQFSWKYVTYFEIKENIGKPIRVVLNSPVEGFCESSDGDRIEIHCNEESFESISRFQIIENQIENPGDLLRCLSSSLGTLMLVGNFTEHLSSTLLEKFTDIWELIISGAKSMDFDFNSLKNPKRLYSLCIPGNNLRKLENVSMLTKFSTIFYLNVAENQLENAAEIFQYVRPKMNFLNLTGDHVGRITPYTFQNLDVYELYLKNTSLSFDNLSVFEPITSLDDDEYFKPLNSLIKLDISYNNLENTSFSATSTTLKNLHFFSASHCNIVNASDLINRLGLTLEIDLSGNDLSGLNANAFENQTQCQHLNLSHTHLKHIDIGKKENLDVLDLSFNDLKTLDLISVARTIESLYLEGNELTEIIPNFTENNFLKLKKVSISMNQIPCSTLVQIMRNWPYLEFVGNSYKQKHQDCSNVASLVDKLGFVGDFLLKWI